MSNQEKVLDIHDVPKWNQWLILSLQHIFAMFGATILVPFLTEMPPNVALITSGLGTLAYIFITKGRIPAYLGSSFAFIAPIIAASMADGLAGAMVGAFLAGIVYGLVALVNFIKWCKLVTLSFTTCCCRSGNYGNRARFSTNRN